MVCIRLGGDLSLFISLCVCTCVMCMFSLEQSFIFLSCNFPQQMNLYSKQPCGEETFSFSMKQVLAHQLSFGIGEGWKGKVSQLSVSWSVGCGARGSQQSLKEKVNLLVNKWLPYCGGGVQIIRGIFGQFLSKAFLKTDLDYRR